MLTRLHPSRRLPIAAAGTFVLLAAAPASASAVGFTVVGDTGQPAPIAAGTTIRNMDTKVGLAADPGDTTNYQITVAGPDGAAASTPACVDASYGARSVDYRGNGAYTVSAVPHDAKDYDCSKAATGAASVAQFTISATVAIGARPIPFLIRNPNALSSNTLALPIQLNPGALGTEVQYAKGVPLGPDGGFAGPSQPGFVDSTTGTVPFTFSQPGTYTVVARQKGFSTGSGTYYTPWSPPVAIKAVAPFDVSSISFPDSIGPSYLVKIYLREPTITGRVSVALARGTKGRYRSLGSVRISSKATASKRFRARSGTYRVRFTYKSTDTILGGRFVKKFRVTRRFAG